MLEAARAIADAMANLIRDSKLALTGGQADVRVEAAGVAQGIQVNGRAVVVMS